MSHNNSSGYFSCRTFEFQNRADFFCETIENLFFLSVFRYTEIIYFTGYIIHFIYAY